MTNPAAILDVQSLTVAFRTREATTVAVRDVSFHVAPGETLALVGESGSGKSVSALATVGLAPDAADITGSVTFEGEEMVGAAEPRLRAMRGNAVSFVFQEPMTSLNPLHTIERQVGEVLKLHRGMSDKAARERTLELLNQVGIRDPEKRLDSFPHQLSGGQRQRVMIAMALANEPDLLIADEPTTALDVTVQAEVLDLMARLQHELGTAIALITHDMGVVARMCDTVKVMRKGSFVEAGPVERIFNSPEHDYTRKLLEAMPRIDSGEAPGRIEGKPILEVDDLKVHFDIHQKGGLFGRKVPLKAVNGVSFGLREGETLGIVGESGCGKSTLARAVLQLIEPSDGTVSWLGKPLTDLDRAALKRERKDLQIVFQDPLASLDPRLTISDSIAEPLQTHRPDMTARERREAVLAMMERVGLETVMYNRYPHELSGGQNQRVGIARAMITRPRLIICDEAVSALDVSIQAQIVQLLKDLQAEFGMSMLFISHDLSVVRAISNRIMVLYLGRIVELGDAGPVCDAPRHPYTQALISAVPVPDPEAERSRRRIRIPGELPSPLDPRASLRFLRSRLDAGEEDYVPQLRDVGGGHLVAEHDPLDRLLARAEG